MMQLAVCNETVAAYVKIASACMGIIAINVSGTTRLSEACCKCMQVAVEKAKGNLPGAIDLLRNYLNVYQTDVGAWEELADLYLQVGHLC